MEADVRHGAPCLSETALEIRCQDIGPDQDVDFQQRIVGLQFDNHVDPAGFQRGKRAGVNYMIRDSEIPDSDDSRFEIPDS